MKITPSFPVKTNPPLFNAFQRRFVAVVAAVLFGFSGPLAAADATPSSRLNSGMIEGRVLNGRSNIVIERARVTVEGTSLETFTDSDGVFRLPLPAGSVRVRVFFTGMAPQLVEAEVRAGETTQREITLTPDAASKTDEVLKMDEFVVAVAREMEAAAIAINEQRFAPNIKNVVSTDEFGAIAEGNVAEFLRYMPGVNIELSGGDARFVSLDGAPNANTPITLAGFMVPSTPGTSTMREIEIGFFNLNNVSRIEVAQSPTPESPGSALAGSVNLVPRSAFERTKPQFKGNVYLMMRDNRIDFDKGPNLYRDPIRAVYPGFDFSWIVPVNKRFGFTLAAGQSTQYSDQAGHTNTWRGLNAVTNGGTFPHTTPDKPYLSAYLLKNAPKLTERQSLGLTLDYKLTEYDRISLSHQFSSFNGWTAARQINFAMNRVNPGFTPIATQSAPGQAVVTAQAGNGRVRETRILMDTLNWRHTGPVWQMEAGAGRTYGVHKIRDNDKGQMLNAIARRQNVTLGFNQINELRPGVLTMTDAAGVALDPFDLGTYSLISVASNPTTNADTGFSAYANAQRHLSLQVPVLLKGGLDFRLSKRDGRTTNNTWTYTGSATPGSAAPFLDTLAARRGSLYGFPNMQFVDYKGIFDHYKANPGQFVLDENAVYTSTVNNSKLAKESISAAYLRGDVAFFVRRLKIVTGLRVEQTNVEAQGPLNDPTRNVRRDANGRPILGPNGQPLPITTIPLEISRLTLIDRGTQVEKEYLRFFPSLNASYNIRENLIARVGLSRSIGAPNFDQYAGGVALPKTDNPPAPGNRIVLNNAAIKPWTADSTKVRLEYYFAGVGQVAVGAFRRDIENFFGNTIFAPTPEFLTHYGLNPDEYGAYEVSTQYNVPGLRRVEGSDISYKQALTFLPNWARGVQVFGNIAWRRTKTTREDSDDFISIPHSGSWGVSLARPRFNVRLNVSFRAAQRQAKQTGAGIGPDTYNYTASRNTVDVLGEYMLTRRLSLYANLRNVGDVPNKLTTVGPETPMVARLRVQEYYGSLWTIGLKGTF